MAAEQRLRGYLRSVARVSRQAARVAIVVGASGGLVSGFQRHPRLVMRGAFFNLQSMGVLIMTTQEILAKVASGEVQPGEAATLIAAMNGNGKSAGQLTYKRQGRA